MCNIYFSHSRSISWRLEIDKNMWMIQKVKAVYWWLNSSEVSKGKFFLPAYFHGVPPSCVFFHFFFVHSRASSALWWMCNLKRFYTTVLCNTMIICGWKIGVLTLWTSFRICPSGISVNICNAELTYSPFTSDTFFRICWSSLIILNFVCCTI